MHQSVAWLSGSQESGWFATGCSQILIFSFFPRPPRDSVNTVIPLVVLSLLLPLSLFAFSLSLSPSPKETHREGGLIPVPVKHRAWGEACCERGMKLLLRNICITKWWCIGWWPVASDRRGAGEGGEKWSSGVDGRVLLASESATLPLHSEGPTRSL